MKIAISTIINDIKRNLTPDLLSKQYKKSKFPLEGHCYVATETLYHILQSILQYRGKYKPFVFDARNLARRLEPGRNALVSHV